MPIIFPTGPGISYAIDSAFAIVNEKSYPIQFNKNLYFLPPANFASMKGWLRSACAEPQSPVNKDPLDQYLYELCGTVFDRLDFVVVNVCEIRKGDAVEEVRKRVLDNPFAYVRVNEPDNVTNFLAEAVISGMLQGVVLLHEMTFNIKLKRASVRPGCAEVETLGGYHYVKNPNAQNISALIRMCKQKSSEHDCFKKLAEAPYDLLVKTRDYRGTCTVKVPRVVRSCFEIINDGSGDETAINELVQDQKLIIRRIYTGEGGPLQVFDYKGRCVGCVPDIVCEWMTPALEYCLAAVSTAKVSALNLGEQRITLSFKVTACLVVIEREEFFGLVSYHLIKNFDYPDHKPIIVTDRQGVPLTPWIEPVYNLYLEYQNQPEKLALPKNMRLCWTKALEAGAINEEKEEQVPADDNKPLPADIFSTDKSSENAISHYDDMLNDASIIKQDIDRARIYILKGKACVDNFRFTEAMNSFVQAEILLRKGIRMDSVYLAYTYISMAKIHIASGDHEDAVTMLGRAAAVLERERRKGRRAVLGLLVSVYILGGDESKLTDNRELAIDAYSGAAELISCYYGSSLGDDEQTAELFSKRGELCAAGGYTVQAVRDLFRAIEMFECRLIHKKPVDRSIVINSYRQRSAIYEGIGYQELAIADKKRAAQLVKRIKRDALNEALAQTKLAAQEKQDVIDTVLRGLSGEYPGVTLGGAKPVERGNYAMENPGTAHLPSRFTSGEDMLLDQTEKMRFERNSANQNKND